MNTEDDKEENRPETQSKIDLNTKLEPSKPSVVSPSKAAKNGSGDHLPSPFTSLLTKETTTDSISKPTFEVGDGDKVINVEVQQDTIDSVDINKQIVSEGNQEEEALVVPPKPTFLESVSSVVSEDVDSENQDEELVLKWDDDEDDTITPLKDDEIGGNLDKNAEKSELLQKESRMAKIDLDQNLDTAIETGEKSSKMTEIDLDHDSEKSKVISKEFDDNAEINNDVQKEVSEDDMIEEPELRMSEDEAEDEQEDLLSEIDAQIAELGASLAKAENENLMNIENSVEAKTIVGSVTDNSEENIITIDELEKVAEITDSNCSNLKETKENKDKQKTTEMELEEALLADDKTPQMVENSNIKPTTKESNITEIKMKIDASDNLENADLIPNHNEKEISLNNSEVLANSTLIGSDNELETSCKDNSFEHDSSSSVDDRIHGVNKPNVMLEIPTQELIDLDESAFLTQDNDMSVDEYKTKDSNVSVDLTDNQHSNEKINTEIESVAKTVNLPSNISVDLTDDKDQENELIEKMDTEKSFDDMTRGAEGVNKVAIIRESIVSNDDKSNPKATQDVEKPSVDVINSSLSTDDVKMKTIEESGKKVDPPESTKEANIDIVGKNTEENLSIAVESTAVDDDNTDIAIQTVGDLKTDNKLAIVTTTETAKPTMDVQPSTSQAGLGSLDPSDDAAEVAEVTDSLGLLAECSRVREDDDADGDGDVDDQETSDHDDYDEDFDPDDESSNQLTAEHSEDSAQHSESDMPKAQDTDKQTTDTDKPFGIIENMATVTETDEKAEDATIAENQIIDQEIGVTDQITEDVDQITEDVDQITEEVDQITEEVDQITELDEGTAEIDQGTSEVDQITEEVDAGTVEGDQETGGKEFGFAISNVVSEESTAKETETEVDIDDEVVCGEVEVTDNLPESDQPPEVDTSALKHLSDTDKDIPIKVCTESKLRELLQKDAEDTKKKKLEMVQPSHVVSIVDLESSSEDESVQKPAPEHKDKEAVTSINISKEIEVMSSGDNTSEIISKEGETVIHVPKTAAALHKIKSRLNTSEITIKTASPSESTTLVIPEAKMGESPKPKFGGLEVFSLDSDEEDNPPASPSPPPPEPAAEPEKPPKKCINSACTSDQNVPFYPADPGTAAFYDCQKKKRAMVCQTCLFEKAQRALKLVEGIKNFTPILALEEVRSVQELVEISDSDSDDEGASDVESRDKIGFDNIHMLGRQLSEILNESWARYQLDARLQHARDELHHEVDKLEKESAVVSSLLDECQAATDKLRGELYATFEAERHQLPAVLIHDTPDKFCICPEAQVVTQTEVNAAKRRLSSASESQAKKPAIQPAIPLADTDKRDVAIKTEVPKPETDLKAADISKLDDDKDISVVNLSAEAAPADLPPPGDTVRAPLQVNQTIFAMRHAFGSWIKARVLEVTPKGSLANAQNFTMCRVKFENKTSRNAYKILPARCLAYYEPSNVRMTIGTRIIALFKDTSADKSGKRESFYSGVVAEVPNPVNKYRYLVFFDDGYAQYVSHADTRLVCEFSALVWEEVHPFSREFVKEYLIAYPERPMVRLHTGQSLKTEWNGKWWLSRVTQVDGSLVQVYFEQDKRTEWIYRGSTRLAPLYLELQAAEKHRARPLPRNRLQNKLNMPYVEYTRFDEQSDVSKTNEAQVKAQQEEIRRQRAVAKKSTTLANVPPQQAVSGNLDAVTSRVVYYTPKNAVKPYKLTSHTCSPKCRRTDVLALKDLRTYNPLAKPLLSGWERQIVRYKGHKEAMYVAPCGRRLRNMAELHRYLRVIGSDMAVDLFHFGPHTHCLAEFVLNKCIVGKKDLSHGKENVPVPCVNYYDDSLPEFCSYNTERTPTAGVPLCVDPEFLCGCDCTDDCQDKSKCACWKMTLEGARTIGLDGDVGYVYRRLPEPLPSGIYECNSRCKCKSTCLNRVAQHPLQLKLQVFKTLNRGWGIRALNDVPRGCFLCIYAGNLLTDATANLDGLNEGDEYLAELDYIEVVEQMKEGYEDDIPEQDKKLDRKEGQAESDSEDSESEEEARNSRSDADDGDFEPGFIPGGILGFNKRLRKRDRKKKEAEKNKDDNKEAGEDDCITISDDEELREPSRFAAQAGMGGAFISKYRSVRTLFGEDEACYIMDAKVQGNIGRYLNHSCSPNVFVQNVFVDTHDPRFPWVAFFASTHIRAGTELTWNYNYDVGSVPGKALYCYCGAPNCRGRLL